MGKREGEGEEKGGRKKGENLKKPVSEMLKKTQGGDFEVHLFRAPKRSIILLKS